MKDLSKKLNKDLSKVFFNSVEEMNQCYGTDAELPSNLHGNTDLVCYKIVIPFVYYHIGQYVFTKDGFHHLDDNGEPVIHNCNEMTLESEVYEDDLNENGGCCFVYVRVNEYLRKHLEKTLIGCEFAYRNNKTDIPYRRFVHSVEFKKLGIVVTDQGGLSRYLSEQLFYPDDHSDPIPYQEWIKQINKQDVED